MGEDQLADPRIHTLINWWTIPDCASRTFPQRCQIVWDGENESNETKISRHDDDICVQKTKEIDKRFKEFSLLMHFQCFYTSLSNRIIF